MYRSISVSTITLKTSNLSSKNPNSSGGGKKPPSEDTWYNKTTGMVTCSNNLLECSNEVIPCL